MGNFAQSLDAVISLKVQREQAVLTTLIETIFGRLRGERYASPIDEDFIIPQFEILFKNVTILLASKLIWKTMCDLKPHAYIKARYRKNASHGSHYADSQIVHQFKEECMDTSDMEVASRHAC